jgi:hypothetical protein
MRKGFFSERHHGNASAAMTTEKGPHYLECTTVQPPFEFSSR